MASRQTGGGKHKGVRKNNYYLFLNMRSWNGEGSCRKGIDPCGLEHLPGAAWSASLVYELFHSILTALVLDLYIKLIVPIKYPYIEGR